MCCVSRSQVYALTRSSEHVPNNDVVKVSLMADDLTLYFVPGDINNVLRHLSLLD